MIQAIYKGIEIELELHQQTHDNWKCDYTLIKHPSGTRTFHQGETAFPTMDQATDNALHQAHQAIDHDL